jgi:hypothetical protein
MEALITPEGHRVQEAIESYYKDGVRAKVIGRFRTCTVRPFASLTRSQQRTIRWTFMVCDTDYVRITENGSKHGRRYVPYRTYDDALAGAFAWGGRKVRRGGL